MIRRAAYPLPYLLAFIGFALVVSLVVAVVRVIWCAAVG